MELFKGITMNGKQKKTVAVIIAVSLIIGAVYLAGIGSRHAFLPDSVAAAGLYLTASDEDSLGIAVDTDFILKSDTQLKAAEVKEFLETEPKLDFAVQATDAAGKEFRITTAGGLEANRIYRFTLGDGSWSFQTKDNFRVVRSLPRDKGWDVPVNSGIEITFSHDNYQDIKEYFEITPKTDGVFERYKRTAVFVPKELKPGTIYTVRLKKGLGLSGSSEALNEDFVFRFETQSPETVNSKRPAFEVYFSRYMYQYPSGERPLLDFSYYHFGSQNENIDMKIDLYKYGDADQFINSLEKYHSIPYWAAYARKTQRHDISTLDKTASFQPPVQKSGSNYYILFPEVLEEGHYIADITCTDSLSGQTNVNQIWLQVTDTSGYVSVATDKTLVWVNSINKGGPAEGAEVELKGAGAVGRTDGDGILVFDTPADMKAQSDVDTAHIFLKLTARGHGTCVLPVVRERYDYYYGDKSHQEYWDYIHLDRELYQPTDTVKLWGIIKPMDGSNPKGGLEVELERSNYYYEHSDGKAAIMNKEIIMEQDCTFSSELLLPNLSPGHYRLIFRLDGEEITGKWLEVATYTKPAYSIDIKKDKQAVFSGKDEISFDIQASFFEGTAVSSMELAYSSNSGAGTVTTDGSGAATVTLTPKYNNVNWLLGHEYFSVYNRLPEAGEINGNANYMVFHNDMNLDSSAGIDGAEAEVTVSLNRVTLGRINSGNESKGQYYDTSWYIGDPVSGHLVTGMIYENRWRKEELGRYYDFINKEVRTRYVYYPEYVPVTDFTITTDAKGQGAFKFSYEEEKSYRIDLETIDGMGRKLTREQFFYGRSFVDYGWMYWDYYHLEEAKEEYRFYGTGEEYLLTFKNNNETLPEKEGSFLYLVNQKGLKSYEVNTEPYFRAEFEEEDIPNLHVTGVYFNGRTYYKTDPRIIQYDREERKLDITVTTDKESYRPGEEAALDVLVKDASGKPRQAVVNISLVDEAMYILMGEGADVLNGLYSKILDSGIVSDAYSHRCPDISDKPAAEGGEGGGERKDFKDTAYFGTIKTDSKGRGSLTVKVPDNLTSWRATFNAVTGDLWAGSGSIPVVVKLPFFVDMVTNQSYLAGDSPRIAVRTFGDAVTASDRVTLSISAPSLFEAEKSIEAAAFETVYFEMPKLPSGSHTVTVKAACGEALADILIRQIEVSESYLSKSTVVYYSLEKNMDIGGSKDGLTRLIFTDGSKAKFIGPLYGLYHTFGKRIDQRLASLYSYNLLNEHFDTEIQKPGEFDAHSYQAPDGGISLLPYSDSEPGLSARVAAMGTGDFDMGFLEGYFYSLLLDRGETEEDISCALWGLAAMDQPVLNQIKSMLGTQGLGVKAKLQLGLALWELGSGNAAREVLEDVLNNYSRVRDPYIIVDSGTDRDDLAQLTSLAAVLAVSVNMPEAEGMYNYVTDNSTKDILVLLEHAMYLSEKLSKTDSRPSEFEYMLDGERAVKKLGPGGAFELMLTPERLSGFEILEAEGDIGLCSIFNETFSPDDIKVGQDMKITRHYYVNGRPVKALNQDDLVKIVIDYSFGDKSLEGLYQVTDFLPSGLKIIAAPYTRGLIYSNIRYPYEVAGQRVSFYLYNSAYHSGSKEPVVYYARVVSKGSFRAQGAFLQNMKADGEIKMTNEEQITIR